MSNVGTSQLSSGSVVVTNSAITASTYIILSNNGSSGTPGALYISARISGTSFTISSTSATDDSLVFWQLIEPNSVALLGNPPLTTPLVNDKSTIKNIPVLAPSITDSGMSDNWEKYMQQITQLVNRLVDKFL